MKKYAIGIIGMIGLFFTFSGEAEAQYWYGYNQPYYYPQHYYPVQTWNTYNAGWGWNNPYAYSGWNNNFSYQQPYYQNWNTYGRVAPIGINATIPLNRGGWISVGFGNGYWGW
jgi:hypothetical protein